MKKRIIALVLIALLALEAVACGAKGKEITVTFKNGIKKVGELKGTAGKLIEGYQDFENQENFEFLGWYETPTFLESSKKDLSKDTFEENTVLYGCFKSLAVKEDTRLWYIVGDGKSPVLKTSAWAGGDVDDAGKDLCNLKLTGNAANEFAITLDLYADDMFQIVYNWQWDGQYGFGKFTDVDASQMESGGGLSGEASKANVKVLMDGNYTITLTTDPDNAALDTVVVVRNGDASYEGIVEEAPFVPGDNTTVVMKGSWVSDWSENIPLDATGEKLVFSITKEFAAGCELYFMVWDNGADTGIGMKYSSVDEASKALLTEADNVKIAADGVYTITADVNTYTLKVTK